MTSFHDGFHEEKSDRSSVLQYIVTHDEGEIVKGSGAADRLNQNTVKQRTRCLRRTKDSTKIRAIRTIIAIVIYNVTTHESEIINQIRISTSKSSTAIQTYHLFVQSQRHDSIDSTQFF